MGKKLTMKEKAKRYKVRTKNGEGKSRNSINHELKTHYITPNYRVLCNAFTLVPKGSHIKDNVTCTNCLKQLARE